MTNLSHVDDSNFESEVSNSTVPVLVDFGATWCAPCQKQLPILEKFAMQNLGTIKVVSVDIDDAPFLAAKFGIKSVPSLFLFNKGTKVAATYGLTTLEDLEKLVSANK